MKSYPRQEKIAELLHTQISQLIRRECSAEHLNGNVSITDIRVSRGGFDCTVYLSSFKGRAYLDKALAEANSRVGRMHSILGKRLRMKKIPPIRFEADEVIEQGMRIDRLLREDRERRGDKPASPSDDTA